MHQSTAAILQTEPPKREPSRAYYLFECLRVKHWVKNLFVLAPLVFSGHFRNASEVLMSVGGFLLFSLTASSVYILNDLVDREKDAASPTNKTRPIAAGKVSPAAAAWLAAALQLGAIVCGYLLNVTFLLFLVAYTVNNVAYSFFLKRKVIVDIISIAIGFVIRILAGSAVIHVATSDWILICTFSVSLCLGFGKRRAELINQRTLRFVNEIYTDSKLDHMMTVSATVALLSYMLYATAPDTAQRFGGQSLLYTIPLVVYGIFRYVAKIQEGKCRDPIDLIYSDGAFTLNVLLWMAMVGFVVNRAY